jgi:GAF domain-containing protein
VFDAIVTNSIRLSGGFSAGVYRFVDGNVHLGAFTSMNPVADETLRASFPRPIADLEHFRTAQQTGDAFATPDTENQPDERLKGIARARGFRSLLHVPLKSNGTPIGAIAISRRNPGSFSAHHVQLLQTFADQAVIAIENVRLFNETKEALERQTATADILKVNRLFAFRRAAGVRCHRRTDEPARRRFHNRGLAYFGRRGAFSGVYAC